MDYFKIIKEYQFGQKEIIFYWSSETVDVDVHVALPHNAHDKLHNAC